MSRRPPAAAPAATAPNIAEPRAGAWSEALTRNGRPDDVGVELDDARAPVGQASAGDDLVETATPLAAEGLDDDPRPVAVASTRAR